MDTGLYSLSPGRESEEILFVDLPEEATIGIFTLGGDLMAQIHRHSTTAGSEDWHPEGLVSGIYLYSVESPIHTRTGKFTVIK